MESEKKTSISAPPVFNFDKIPVEKPSMDVEVVVENSEGVGEVVKKLVLTAEHFKAFGINQITTLKYLEPMNKTIEKYNINTPLRLAHFMTQVLHESGGLRYSEELASGEAYEGRKDLGNIHPGDGILFAGKGALQITGRHTYEQFGKYIGMDLTTGTNSKKVSKDVNLCCEAAGWFWDVFKKDKSGNNLNNMADNDLFLRITYFLNGGQNGCADRLKKLKLTYKLFGVDNIEERLNNIYNYIENNLNISNRTTGLHNALFKAVPDLKTLQELKKI